MRAALLLLACAAAALVGPSPCGALKFKLGMVEEKCVSEVVNKNDLVTGEFEVDPREGEDGSSVNVRLTDPRGAIKFERNGRAAGKFALTAAVEGEFRVCFGNQAMSQRTVEFSFNTGVSAKDYKAVAKKDNLKPLEVELRRLEDITGKIHDELKLLATRGQEMRATNDATSSRMFLFSVLSVGVLLVLGVSQLVYLRRYFKSRKLID